MVVVSHLFLFLRNKFRGRHDSCDSCLPLFRTVYFPTAPLKLFKWNPEQILYLIDVGVKSPQQ